MTTATTIKEITNKYYSDKAEVKYKNSVAFVNKLINGKIKTRASQGYSYCTTKIAKDCSRTIIRDELADRGFSVGTKATLFSYKMIIKW